MPVIRVWTQLDYTILFGRKAEDASKGEMDRFTLMQGDFALQIVFSCQT